MTDQFREQLAAYQAQLLELFAKSESAKEACESIKELATQFGATGHHDVDHRMVDVAMRLTQKWGARR